jgi:transposase
VVEFIGIDVHKRDSQVCILSAEGELLLEKRIRTNSDRFRELLGSRPPARILVEASTESEWVARSLEGLGHEVIVADPNFAAMYATRSRKVKTDKRDARTLAEACRLGAYHPAHRVSDEQRQSRGRLAVREVLVRTRTRFIALVGALLRSQGLRVASGSADRFVERVQRLVLPGHLQSQIAPLLAVMLQLNPQIAFLDEVLERGVQQDEAVARLATAPGVGPVVATAFVATLDDPERFRGAHQVESFLGLVPQERSSGEKQHKGPTTKSGNGRMRWLLVQAAWAILRSQSEQSAPLREWASRLAQRRGKNVAVVALARRLAGILFAMWRDGKNYEMNRLQARPDSALPAAA